MQKKGVIRMLDDKKRVHFACPIKLWQEFRRIYPYKGEPTAFFNRCIEQVVKQQQRKVSDMSMNKLVDELDEEVT
jgi:hypothetical protein